MMPDIHSRIYSKLFQLIPNVMTFREALKLKAPGFMDLNVDLIEETKEYRVIALSHYYKHQSGDMIPDPDMVVRIQKQSHTAEALSFQDMYRYVEVYSEREESANRKVKAELNQFLDFWLSNLLAQGHKSHKG